MKNPLNFLLLLIVAFISFQADAQVAVKYIKISHPSVINIIPNLDQDQAEDIVKRSWGSSEYRAWVERYGSIEELLGDTLLTQTLESSNSRESAIAGGLSFKASIPVNDMISYSGPSGFSLHYADGTLDTDTAKFLLGTGEFTTLRPTPVFVTTTLDKTEIAELPKTEAVLTTPVKRPKITVMYVYGNTPIDEADYDRGLSGFLFDARITLRYEGSVGMVTVNDYAYDEKKVDLILEKLSAKGFVWESDTDAGMVYRWGEKFNPAWVNKSYLAFLEASK